MRKRLLSIPILLLALGGTLVGAFQACGKFQTAGSDVMASGAALIVDHPSSDAVIPPSQRIQVAGKSYVAALMRDIFSPPALQNPAKTYDPGGLQLMGNQAVDMGDGFVLVMQLDGNAVMYNGSAAVWNSATQFGPNGMLVFQGDGNLVVYNMATNPPTPFWSSATSGAGVQLQLFKAAPYIAILDANRNIVYSGGTGLASVIDPLIEKWILFRPSQFGGSCNTYDTYATADCGGGVTNASLPSLTADTSLRESYLLQFCTDAMADDRNLIAALGNAGLAPTSVPTTDSIARVYGLFYRDEPPDADVMKTLTDLDATLSAAGEPPLERWRALFLMVCQSPSWQLL